MTKENIELKPCPFCGGEDLDFIESECEQFVLVSCCDCCCSSCSDNDKEKAIKSWNTRTESPRVEDALEKKLLPWIKEMIEESKKMKGRKIPAIWLAQISVEIKSILSGDTEVDFVVTKRKSARRK